MSLRLRVVVAALLGGALALALQDLGNPPRPQLVINEFLALNRATSYDEARNSSDWVEIFNAGDSAIDLAGFALTDNPGNLEKWTFPHVSMPPHGYLLVWCSGNDRASAPGSGALHASFKLKGSGGERLMLVAPDGTIQDAVRVPLQTVDRSYGRSPNGSGVPAYHLVPTPLAENRGPTSPRPIPTHPEIVPAGGRFAGALEAEMRAALPGDDYEIRYTTDGSEPVADSSLYRGPIPLHPPRDARKSGAILRAAAFSRGRAVTRIETQSYFFATESYRLPLLSIAMAPSDYERLHNDSVARGIASERRGHLELLDSEGRRVIAMDGGLRLHGGGSRVGGMEAKKSYRAYFRKEYEAGRLLYPSLAAPAAGLDKLVLRANYNDAFREGADATYIRDSLLRELQRAMGDAAPNDTWLNLFVNMEYRGIYNAVERIDRQFLERRFPDESEGWDVVRPSLNRVVSAREGDLRAWNELVHFVETNDLRDDAVYERALEMVDLGNFVRYFILNIWAQSGDWPYGNFSAARPRRPGGKWVFFIWDAEITMRGSPERFNVINNIYRRRRYPLAKLFIGFMDNRRFRSLFREEFERHLAGVLHPRFVLPAIDRLRAQLGPDMVHEMRLWAPDLDVRRWHHNVKRLGFWTRNREGFIREFIFGSPHFSVSPEPPPPPDREAAATPG